MTQSDSKRYKTDYPLLHEPGWLDVMLRHQGVDASEFALRFASRKDWPVREIAEQLHCYPRAQEKLGPLHRPGMIYLREALEQASGYATATWRARNWVTNGEKSKRSAVSTDDARSGARLQDNPDSSSEPDRIIRVADLTGGLGIDTAAFGLAGAEVAYCERNPMLAVIARHNHQLLGLDPRICWHTGDGMEWLASRKQKASQPQASQTQASQTQGSQTQGSQSMDSQSEALKLDLLYIDPSRRPGGKRVLSLQDSEPDVTRHLALIRSSAYRYLVKLSPMMDPVDAARTLEDCVSVTAVSVVGELKELLADCVPAQDRDAAARRPDPVFRAVMIDASGGERFRFSSDLNDNAQEAGPDADNGFGGDAGTLLFEPDAALFKMRLIEEVARRYGLVRIHPGIGYLTNGQLPTPSGQPTSTGPPTPSTPESFPGKVFRIRGTLPFKPRHLKKWLEEAGLTRVHIHQRGFSHTVDQLYKKLGCRMGEDAHLFATMTHDGQRVVIVADRIG